MSKLESAKMTMKPGKGKALVSARAALKAARSSKSYPEWAIKALAAGWKAPKGWTT